MINTTAPVYSVLRLLSFCSLLDGGIPPKKFDVIKQLIMDVRIVNIAYCHYLKDILFLLIKAYGIKYIYVIDSLVNVGLLCICDDVDRAYKFSRIVRMLDHSRTNAEIQDSHGGEALIITHIIVNIMKDVLSIKVSGAHEGSKHQYRFIQALQGFNNFLLNNFPNGRIFKSLPGGPYFEFLNQPCYQSSRNNAYMIPQFRKKSIILIVFVGGCTYSEVSAIRALSKKNGM